MNLAIVKYLILLLTMPWWLPFMKALWQELNDALREQGGLFGDEPSATKLAEIRREIAMEEERVINEPIAHARAQRESSEGTYAPAGGPARLQRR